MAIYTPEQLKMTPPPGGFQTGGWYQSRQFWNGTLSDPGTIHPESNQPGAGGVVNPEVVKATNPQQGLAPGTNEEYIKSQWALNPKPATGTPTTPGAGTTGAGTAGGGGMAGAGGITSPVAPTTAINLPDIYTRLFAESDISGKETRIRDLESKYLEAKGKISDNPFLSASMIDQRLQRLDRKYEQETKPLRDEIATKKADIETQLNLQAKQFDINSQASKDALNLFTTVLESGGFDTANGEDIASFTRATGLPSSVFYSAINARKAQAEGEANIDIKTFTADSGEVTATVFKDGELYSQTSLGRIGNAQTGGKATETEVKQSIMNDLQQEASQGTTWDDLFQMGLGYVDPLEIYQIYLGAGFYKPTEAQKLEDLKRYGIEGKGFQASPY
jgi:hypothetical protein